VPCESPTVQVKTLQNSICILHVLLRLLPHVENGAIFTCAQYVLDKINQCLIRVAEIQQHEPGAKNPDNVGIESIILKSALEALMSWSLVFGKVLQDVDGSYGTLHHLVKTVHMRAHLRSRRNYTLLTLLFALRGVLHPMHVTVLTANFIKPPTVGVAICILLVCPPDTVHAPICMGYQYEL
jgi:hypothetical protein